MTKGPRGSRWPRMTAVVEPGQGEFRSDLAYLHSLSEAMFEHAPPQQDPGVNVEHGALYETGLLFSALVNPWPTDQAKAMLANWRRTRTEVVG